MASSCAEGACLICSGPYSSAGLWINCNGCNRWFHRKCVGVSDLNDEELVWRCVICTTYGRPAKAPLKLKTSETRENPGCSYTNGNDKMNQESKSWDNVSMIDLLDAISSKLKKCDQEAEKPKKCPEEIASDPDESILNLDEILASKKRDFVPKQPSIPVEYQGNLFCSE
jgi:hypothetical protein